MLPQGMLSQSITQFANKIESEIHSIKLINAKLLLRKLTCLCIDNKLI